MVSVTKYPKYVDHTYTSKTRFNIPKYHLKKWGGFDTLTKAGGKIECGTGAHPTIAGKNGTYNKPGGLYVCFGSLGLKNGTKLKMIKFHFKQNKVSGYAGKTSAKDLPDFAGPNIKTYNEAIQNNKSTEISIQAPAPSTEYKEYVLEFKNIKSEDVNSDDFGFLIYYAANTSSNEGRLFIGDIFIEIVTDTTEVSYSINSNASSVDVGQYFEVTLDVTQKDSSPYTPVFDLDLDDAIGSVTKVSGDGTITDKSTEEDPNFYQWTATLNNKKASIRFKCKASKKGIWTLSMVNVFDNTQSSIKVNVVERDFYITTTCRDDETPTIKSLHIDKISTYHIQGTTTNSSLTQATLEIQFPYCTNFENQGVLETENSFKLLSTPYDKETHEATDTEFQIIQVKVDIENYSFDLDIKVVFGDSGVYPITINYNQKIIDTCNITVLPKSYNKLSFSRFKVTDEDVLESMSTNLDYTAVSHAKYIYTSNGKSAIIPNSHEWQTRFGVFNSPYDLTPALEEEDDYLGFLSNVQWSNKTTNILDEYRVTFRYNKNYPLWFVWALDYKESPFLENVKLEFTEPELYETKNNKSYHQTPALYPKPLINHIIGDGYYATCTIPALKKTNIIRLHNFNESVIFKNGQDVVCQGLQVEWDYEINQSVEIIINVRAYTKDIGGVSGKRSITLEGPTGNAQTVTGTKAIGGRWDLYGLSPHYFRSDNLEWLWVDVQVVNPNNTDAVVKLSDFKLNVFLMDINIQDYSFEVNGERAEEYGIFFKKMDWDWGTQNDVNYYQTNGTDVTTAYRSNITKKELTLEFDIGNCDIKESGILLEKVVKLFTNERTLFNKPIPKRIIFDHLPEYEFWFVREDALEVEEEYGMYSVKCKLVIPEGTALNRTMSITGTSGANTGIARVTPEIMGICNKKKIITINESMTSQALTINSDDIEISDKFRINCSNRKVYLTKSNSNKVIDITKGVSWDSVWFSIEGEYNFSSPDSNITSVKFKERT